MTDNSSSVLRQQVRTMDTYNYVSNG